MGVSVGIRWHRALYRLRDSFWTVPLLCIALAAALAHGLVWVEEAGYVPEPIPWPGSFMGSTAATEVLSAIATTTFSAATMAFSITISVVATTSTTYGPRLVRNFMADRRNQMVLGALLGTFVYALVILRAIRGSDNETSASVFVPHLGTTGAMVLAVIDVLLVVFFIQHISGSVQIDSLTERTVRQFEKVVRHRTDRPGERKDIDEIAAEVAGFAERHVAHPDTDGYVVGIAHKRLRSLAEKHGARIHVQAELGGHVLPHQVIAVTDTAEVVDAIQECITVDSSRSAVQDIRFAEQQGIDLVLQALAPASMDSYTAVNAVQSLSAGVCRLVAEEEPANFIAAGKGWVSWLNVTTDELVDKPFDHIRPVAVSDVQTVNALVDLAVRIDETARDRSLAERAWHHAELAVREAIEAQDSDRDKQRLRDHYEGARQADNGPEDVLAHGMDEPDR